MTTEIYSIVNWYGRTVWHVRVGSHFLGAFATKADAERAATVVAAMMAS